MSEERWNNVDPIFPALSGSGYHITSPATPEYNCIAWAAGDDEIWWWPDSMMTCYWPPQVPRKETRQAFIQAYETLGYALCSTMDYEEGFEKIAIYELNGKPTHAARQLKNGHWTSKLGRMVDIEHYTLDGLHGDQYGVATVIMRRRLNF